MSVNQLLGFSMGVFFGMVPVGLADPLKGGVHPRPPAGVLEDCQPNPRGETPVPFCDPNTRFELADGESYTLPGWLVVGENGKVTFQVNLTRVPHLANNIRKASPYFRMVQGPLVERAARENPNQEVTISVVARARVATASDTGELRPEIFLELVKTP